ncbi:MAG TPA: PDZ domain-containing protein [Aggregatilineales bacterium]|nr:PDZ domain-containing protein [Aggregatilineales bacterium]
MRRDSTFLRISPILLLALIAALALQSSASGVLAANVQATAGATMAGTAAQFAMCMPPTPTPTATGQTPQATVAATEAAPAATTVATTVATMAATAPAKAPTATKVPPTPTVTPTATKLVTGQKPVTALIVVGTVATGIVNGHHCLQVMSVTAGGPGALAGMKKGDWVLALDGVELASAPDFFAKLDQHVSGDVVAITLQRGTTEMTVKVTLGVVPI